MSGPRRSFRKGADQSTSLLGTLLHEREPRTFDVIDMDCVVNKSERKCLRYFEEKLPGEELSRGQHRNLGLLACFLKVGVAFNILKSGGVYIVWWPTDCPDEITDDSPIRVQQVCATPFHTEYRAEWSGVWADFRPLFTGERWTPKGDAA